MLGVAAVSIVLDVLGFVVSEFLFILSSLFGLAVFLPTLAVTARRLHDIGKSGWWQVVWIVVGLPSAVVVVLGAVLAFGLALLGSLFGDSGLTGIGFVVLIVGLVPFAGTWLWVIAWLARPSDAGANSHGPDPRAA